MHLGWCEKYSARSSPFRLTLLATRLPGRPCYSCRILLISPQNGFGKADLGRQESVRSTLFSVVLPSFSALQRQPSRFFPFCPPPPRAHWWFFVTISSPSARPRNGCLGKPPTSSNAQQPPTASRANQAGRSTLSPRPVCRSPG